MKKERSGKRGVLVILAAAMVFSQIPFGAVGYKTSQAEEASKVRTVNLNVNGTIAGIGDPTSTDPNTAIYWSGSYVNFGNYENEPILCRVLDANTIGEYSEKETMLLQSGTIWKQMAFRQDYTADDASEWAGSDIRMWLRERVLPQFNLAEQKAIVPSTKLQLSELETELEDRSFEPLQEDTLFLLDAAEGSRTSYGYCKSKLRAIEKTAWWTRSRVTSLNNHQGAFCPIGNSVIRGGYETKVGVVPAWNVDLSQVGFAFQSGLDKTGAFRLTQTGSRTGAWNLVLRDGNGFEAKLGKSQDKKVSAGADVTIEVTALASGNENAYTQISAMLADDSNVVAAYGKAARELQTGEFTFSLPEELPQGRYRLKIFEESVCQTGLRNQNDYMSNMADIELLVGDESIPEPPETEPIETEPPETEPPETEPIETEPIETEPIETEPIETEPIETEPIETEPIETEPIEIKPIETEPIETQLTETETKATEPTQMEGRLTGTKIVKLTGMRKGFRVKWKRVKKGVSGYEIQYTLKRNWKGKHMRTVKIRNAKTRKKTVKGLKPGKRYHVRIRTWKQTGKNVRYSAWSNVRRVKIKK